MTSGVVGMRSHLSLSRGFDSIGINGSSVNSNQLKTSIEDMKRYAVQLLERLDSFMTEDICDHKSSLKLIAKVCRYLKSEGSRLDEDIHFRQQLDLYFDLLRNILRKPKLSPLARTMILEVIELRACRWATNEDIEEYYRRKMTEFEAIETTNDFGSELQKSRSLATLGSDVLKCSANKPTKVSGKTFLRDEVLIRNGDSGKVTAGAKERLVQITGPSEDNIEKAKQLIESTIKRNASPVPLECPNKTFDDKPSHSSSDSLDSKLTVVQKFDETLETRAEPQMAHTFTVLIESEVIQLSTNNYNLGLRAQHLLEQLLLKPNKEQTSSALNRQSSSDSTSGEDFDKNKENVSKSESKPNLKSDLESASRMAPTDYTVNKIQRSSSQGTVPVGRTSMRFLSCSEDSHKNVRQDSHPTIQYERHFLMECSQLSSSKNMPNIEVMANIYKKTPEIIRKHNNSGENTNSSAVQKSQSFTERKSSLFENWE